jgi:hypothetical protein
MTLLHKQATDRVRATVVSLNSWISQPAGALGAIVITALAQATSVSMAMYVGAIVLAAAAPLYLPAWRQSRMDTKAAAGSVVPQPRGVPAAAGEVPGQGHDVAARRRGR